AMLAAPVLVRPHEGWQRGVWAAIDRRAVSRRRRLALWLAVPVLAAAAVLLLVFGTRGPLSSGVPLLALDVERGPDRHRGRGEAAVGDRLVADAAPLRAPF